jgi:hypothetical protein
MKTASRNELTVMRHGLQSRPVTIFDIAEISGVSHSMYSRPKRGIYFSRVHIHLVKEI